MKKGGDSRCQSDTLSSIPRRISCIFTVSVSRRNPEACLSAFLIHPRSWKNMQAESFACARPARKNWKI